MENFEVDYVPFQDFEWPSDFDWSRYSLHPEDVEIPEEELIVNGYTSDLTN